MRNLILRFCRWALPLLGVNVAVSCDNVIIGAAPEYGVPVKEFRICGKAEDAKTGQPVKGIAVTYNNPVDPYERQDTTWTSENGEFIVQRNTYPPSDKMILKFTDVDGSENGEYSVEKVEVPLVWQEESQDGWKVGIFAADDVKVMLDPVEPSESE